MNNDRRDFLKKGAYAAPTVLTLAAMPSFAGTGSGQPGTSVKSDKSEKSGKSFKIRRRKG